MDENSMAYVHLAKDDLLGSYPRKGRLDLLNIVLIGISIDQIALATKKSMEEVKAIIKKERLYWHNHSNLTCCAS